MGKDWRTKSKRGKAVRSERTGAPIRYPVQPRGDKGKLPTGVTVMYPSHAINYNMQMMNPNDIKFSEMKPENLDERAKSFMDSYRRGVQIPPILVHRMPNGDYVVVDGHARLEAYRRLGVKRIPVVENLIGELIGKFAGTAVRYGKKIQGGIDVAKEAYTTQVAKGEMDTRARIALQEEERMKLVNEMADKARSGNKAAAAYMRKYHPDIKV